jgi:CubicO group peptidase (beta-lactamase class C family)
VSWISARRLAIALLSLTGCPADDVAADVGGSETGDPGTEPLDPVDGEGSVPPGDPDQEDRWVAPSTLGNGLVHDTRSAVDPSTHAAAFTSDKLAAGAAWSSFVGSNAAMLARGFRPAQVDAVIELTEELEIMDETLYISDDDANYRTEVFTHVFPTLASERDFADWQPVALGARPTSIQTFAEEGRVGYSVAWVYDSATTMPTVEWDMRVGQTKEELDDLLGDASRRPISLSSRRRDGASEYAVIFVPTDSAANWSTSTHVQTSSLASEISDRWQDGLYPFRITAEQGDSTYVNVLWALRPPGISVQTRVNLTDSAFADEDGWWRSHGYHLETVENYVNGGEERRAAVWVRYQAYLRWEGTEFDPGDPNYAFKYKMFHDQTVRMIGNLTEIDCSGGQPCPGTDSCHACPGTDSCHACPADYPCFYDEVCVEEDFGRFTRPSATLHIFEGPTVVLNRAYTFAPAIYPDTPPDVAFKTASVSKAITATAVVREMDVQGLSLWTTSFAGAVGVGANYDLSGALVRDVLMHTAGFAKNQDVPDSYVNHEMIVGAGATAPVDGEELFEYVFAPPGHIDIGTDDSYWETDWRLLSLANNSVRYSNVGYSLLGELVRIQSGVPYDEYVRSELLTPVVLQNRVFPDPGSRVRTRGLTMVRTGSYLVDTAHPYNVASPNPQQPAVALAANPVEDWLPYLGPEEPRAPARATERYGGRRYFGGATLAAGGWWADGEALGRLIRTISRTNTLLPLSMAAWMWHPGLWNTSGPVTGWAYVHGWYSRGNWVGWMGSDRGAAALTLHNRMYDVTVVVLANGLHDRPADFIDALMVIPPNQTFSPIGQVWPCVQDPSFGINFLACAGANY